MSINELKGELDNERKARLIAEKRISDLEAEILELKNNNFNKALVTNETDNLLQLSDIFSLINYGFLSVDMFGTILSANDVLYRQLDVDNYIIGIKAEEVFAQLGLSEIDIFNIHSSNEIVTQKILSIHNTYYSVLNIPSTKSIFKNDVWLFIDYSKETEEKKNVEVRKTFLEHILNNIPGDIVAFDAEHRYLYINPVAVKNAEIRNWLVGKTDKDYCIRYNRPMKIAEERFEIFNQVKTKGIPIEWEEKLLLTNGDEEFHLRKMSPVFNAMGELELVIGYGVNITERKHIEERILLGERKYREIFNYSQVWICTHKLDGELISVNPSACSLLGYAEHELVGMNLIKLLPENARKKFVDDYLTKISASGSDEGLMSILNKEGKPHYLLYHNHLKNEKGVPPYVIGFAQNVTDKILAENALKQSEEKYRYIIDSMNMGMLEINLEGEILFANQRFCDMSGYELEELLTKNATVLFFNKSFRNLISSVQKKHIVAKQNYEFEVKIKNGDLKWWLVSTAPLFYSDGKVKGTVSICLDINKQKTMETKMRNAVMQSEKSAHAKEIFLANMSHEIRTPINAIMGLGKLLSKGTNLDEKQTFYLSSIRKASENLLVIIDDILDISKIEAGEVSIEKISLDLNEIVSQVITMLEPKAEEKGLLLISEIDENIALSLIGDPYRINQVLINMVNNAIKFTDKGYIRLRVNLTETVNDTQTIVISIEDTGVGIDEEFIGKIYNNFSQEDETVVRKFGGTGLGMSITRQLMELMGGRIEVKSKKNYGTTIVLTFHLKVSSRRVIVKKNAAKTDTSHIANAKVLLVEDNELNSLLAYTILTQYGAIVTNAENGAIAIEYLHKNKYDIVLMDVQMPVMDGITATRIIREEMKSDIPVIALTANAIKGKMEEYMKAGMNDYIAKPYNEDKMIAVIANLLSKSTKTEQEAIFPQTELKLTLNDSVNTPLFDLKKLIQIAGDNTDFINQMLRLFVTDVPDSMAKIKEAYAIRDFQVIKYLAHRIRPSLQNMCVDAIKEETLMLENMAIAKDAGEEMENVINKMSGVINIVTAKIKADYNV